MSGDYKSSGWTLKGSAPASGGLPSGELEGQVLAADSTPDPVWTYDRIRPPDFGFEMVNHFLQAVPNGATSEFLITSLTGASAAVTVSAGDTRPGIAVCNTAATTTGRAGVQTAFTTLVRLANGTLVFRSKFRVPVLSDGTDTFAVRCGFTDGNAGSVGTDGAYFEFDANTDTSIQCVNAQGGTRTTTDSGFVLPADTDVECEIEMTPATVIYRLNGTEVANVNTNSPTGAQAFGVAAGILKSAGTNARTAEFDYVYLGARGI